MISNFSYTPTDGLKNKSSFPTYPANEDAWRKQFQDMFDQIPTEINAILSILHTTTLGASGTEEDASPTITGITGNTIYSQIYNLLSLEQSDKAYLLAQMQAMTQGSVSDGAIIDSKLSDTPGQIKDRLSNWSKSTAGIYRDTTTVLTADQVYTITIPLGFSASCGTVRISSASITAYFIDIEFDTTSAHSKSIEYRATTFKTYYKAIDTNLSASSFYFSPQASFLNDCYINGTNLVLILTVGGTGTTLSTDINWRVWKS